MPSYDALSEFGVGENPDALTTDPYWVIAVIRFQNPVTYSRSKNGSFSTLFGDAVKTRGKPLIIMDDCVQISVQNTKANHLTNFNAVLMPGPINYLAEIMPGDWVAVWMMNDRKTADVVIEKIRNGQPANGFMSGLKFLGRAHAPRKQIIQDPGTGMRQARYTLSGTGFGEFDSTLFYEPHLAEKIPQLGRYFAKLGVAINDIIRSNGQGIDVNKAIVTYLDLLLGKGVPQNLGLPGGDIRLKSTAGLEAGYSYILPAEVGSLIGKTQKTKAGGILAYSDILEVLYGVQAYSDPEISTDEKALIDGDPDVTISDVQNGQLFNPTGARGPGSRRFTGIEMLGTFLPTVPQFTNKSVWSILNTYLNSAVNEMFTCLRVNGTGEVVPTLVVRQLPFTTPLGDPGIPTTPFHDLPRWKIHPILAKRVDYGRSDSLRINFIHVYGDSGPDKTNLVARQIIDSPPARDDLDIARSGLRPYMQSVNCHTTDIRTKGPEKWIALLSDFLMGQHMTFTGTIDLVGIQAPICVGDNLEFDDVLFHIEAITHSCSISPDGRKTFTTSVQLSHGVRASASLDDLHLYAGIEDEDLRTYEPGLTNEGTDLGNTQGGSEGTVAVAGPDLSEGVS